MKGITGLYSYILCVDFICIERSGSLFAFRRLRASNGTLQFGSCCSNKSQMIREKYYYRHLIMISLCFLYSNRVDKPFDICRKCVVHKNHCAPFKIFSIGLFCKLLQDQGSITTETLNSQPVDKKYITNTDKQCQGLLKLCN